MTDKIEVEKLAVIKERENRDLDTLVDENTLVAGETGAGVFGVFKFFQGIKAFFKGITALGTLAKTNKIPVLQDDGSLKFTTPADITSGLATTTELNNVLTNYQTLLAKATYLNSGVNLNDYKDNAIYTKNGTCENQPSGQSGILIVSSGKAYKSQMFICPRIVGGEYIGTINYIRWCSDTNIWTQWSKLTTETDLNNALENYEKTFKYNVSFGVALNTDERLTGFKTFVLQHINEWKDGDLIKIVEDSTAFANFHIQKITNDYFNIFYLTYYQTFPINYRYINGSWHRVTATTTIENI